METFFEIVGIVAVAVSAFSALAFVGNRVIDHAAGYSPTQRLARRVDALEAEIEETDDIAGHNSDLADAVADRLDDAESRLEAQRDFIFDMRERLDVVEDVAAGRVVPTAKAK